jgi:uncharacterized protein (TIGR02453 family)
MINQSTFNFLTDLTANNNREWFNDNKPRYEEARDNVIAFAAELIKQLHRFDKAIALDTDPKKCVMRIYRDIRFSKDKTPYKDNFGIGNLRSGNVHIGYYVQVQPGRNLAGGGYWMPEADHLKLIRQEIDYNGNDLKKIVDEPQFKKLFGEFRAQEQLKSMPRDYDPANENISLIKLKSFAALHIIPDADMMKKDIPQKVAGVLAHIHPLTTFLKNAIA